MGFLDNSGDIILDAVLTDTGRFRLSKGDGSFNVAKFALGDDEINYRLYDKTHDSGSAYYDIEILQTPVLEAFTNNTSTMKSKLITISRTNLLYLPVIKLNEDGAETSEVGKATSRHSSGTFLIAVDDDTVGQESAITSNNDGGVINGFDVGQTNTRILFDQGIDNAEAVKSIKIDPDLQESQYIIQMDSRLGKLVSPDGVLANLSFKDDDGIATYYVTAGAGSENTGYITDIPVHTGDASSPKSVLEGKRGSRLMFSIKASDDLTHSTTHFTKFGGVLPSSGTGNLVSGVEFLFIDSIIRIMGATTGYSVELPVRYIKKN